MDKKTFNKWNWIVALAVLVVSSVTYLSTIEPTASFWDCGEFIASSYKLEVGHPPGNPVFQLLARFFTIGVKPEHAAVAVNAMNAILSALTIFFLYLTIVFFAKRLVLPRAVWGGKAALQSGRPEAAGDSRGQSPLKKDGAVAGGIADATADSFRPSIPQAIAISALGPLVRWHIASATPSGSAPWRARCMR